jgi:hypothetical protein
MLKMNSILIDSLETLGFQVWATRNARPLWPASFDHTLHLFKEANVDAKDLQALLNKIEVKSKNNSLAKIMCRSPGQASFTRSLRPWKMTILPCLLMLLVMRTLVDDVFLVVFLGSTIQCLQHAQQKHDSEKFSHVYNEYFCSAVIVRLHFFFFSLLAISCFPIDDKVHVSFCLTYWKNHCRIHGSILHRRWRWKKKWKQRFVLRDSTLHPHLNIVVLLLILASSQELE